jgi:hypothetical protein
MDRKEERIKLLSMVDIFEPLSREEIERLNGQLPDLDLEPGESSTVPRTAARGSSCSGRGR